MFEIFADKFGYFELADIKRQKLGWGREVAISLSQGRVAEAVDKLVANNRLIGKINKEESVKSLLDDWHSSAFAIDQRLIISVKNADVEIINMVVI